jgi:hypothetical protein
MTEPTGWYRGSATILYSVAMLLAFLQTWFHFLSFLNLHRAWTLPSFKLFCVSDVLDCGRHSTLLAGCGPYFVHSTYFLPVFDFCKFCDMNGCWFFAWTSIIRSSNSCLKHKYLLNIFVSCHNSEMYQCAIATSVRYFADHTNPITVQFIAASGSDD